MRETIKRLHPGQTAANALCPASPSTRLVYQFDAHKSTLALLHSNIVLARFKNVLNDTARHALLAAWQNLKAAGPKYHDKDDTVTRSESRALHTGIWCTKQKEPCLTADSRNQPPHVAPFMKAFNEAIQTHLSPVIYRLAEIHFPKQLELTKIGRRWGKNKVQKTLPLWPECDFGGAFLTVAVKEGVSEILHVDWNDHPESITWIVPVWDEQWVGGDLWVPQVGEAVQVQNGDAISVCTRTLAHSGTKIEVGNRLVFTLFTDRTLLGRALDVHRKGLAKAAAKAAAKLAVTEAT